MQGHLMQKSRTLVDKKRTKKIKYNKKPGESEKKSDKAHHLVSALVLEHRLCACQILSNTCQAPAQSTHTSAYSRFPEKVVYSPVLNYFPFNSLRKIILARPWRGTKD